MQRKHPRVAVAVGDAAETGQAGREVAYDQLMVLDALDNHLRQMGGRESTCLGERVRSIQAHNLTRFLPYVGVGVLRLLRHILQVDRDRMQQVLRALLPVEQHQTERPLPVLRATPPSPSHSGLLQAQQRRMRDDRKASTEVPARGPPS